MNEPCRLRRGECYEGGDDAMNIEEIVRLGTVTAVDSDRRIAKVWFDALNISSGWLSVLNTGNYLPEVNEKVLVLYFPVFNGDGVILGGVQPWR